MITTTSLLHAATHRGIFAAATSHGWSGAVLLASLSINLSSEHDRRVLLELIASDEITALGNVSADQPAAEHWLQAELVERGIPEAAARPLVQRSWLCDTSHVPDRWYYALLLPAQAATVDTLQEICAQWWNRYAGINY